MESDIYEQLAAFLDDLPAGFPRSETRIELRILQKLFTPEEARLAMHPALIAEEAPVIAVRAGLPLDETERMLGEMARKRIIHRFLEPGKPAHYMAEQFLIGFWEGQVNRLDRELVELFEEYLPTYARSGIWEKGPQLRTIPVGESIPVRNVILPYEQIGAIVAAHSKFAVTNCICRQEMRLVEHGSPTPLRPHAPTPLRALEARGARSSGRSKLGVLEARGAQSACDKPLETCLAFDGSADYLVNDGRGRYISREETLALIRQAEQTGLVLQPGNDRSPGNICMCCGCCCGVLRALKMNPSPARMASSPFYSVVDREACAGCGTCLERCPMDAISLPDGAAEVDRERCIGCGLCVTTCPQQALALARKPEDEQRPVPRDIVQATIRLAQSRGKLGPFKMASLAARSAADRLRAAVKNE